MPSLDHMSCPNKKPVQIISDSTIILDEEIQKQVFNFDVFWSKGTEILKDFKLFDELKTYIYHANRHDLSVAKSLEPHNLHMLKFRPDEHWFLDSVIFGFLIMKEKLIMKNGEMLLDEYYK